jgi:hypothetical protein
MVSHRWYQGRDLVEKLGDSTEDECIWDEVVRGSKENGGEDDVQLRPWKPYFLRPFALAMV